MLAKKQSRLRRSKKSRAKILDLKVTRLSVFRSNQHIYAQVIAQDRCTSKVVAAASTLQSGVLAEGSSGGNIAAAAEVGKRIAELALAAGVVDVAFDRSGFRYHGRIKALAEAARAAGLKF